MFRKSSSRAVPIDPNFAETCFLCEQQFQFGMHVYDGKHVADWGIMVCNSCKNGNWDGIVLEHHPKLRRLLNEKGVEYKLNAKGWLDFPV